MSKRDGMSIVLAIAGVAMLAVAAILPFTLGHPVSDWMIASAETMNGQLVTAEQGSATDGRDHSPRNESIDRPLVLVFIKPHCLCSESAEVYFHRLHTAYGSRAHFLGVIDGDLTIANEWMTRHRTPYPIIADSDHRIINATKAERSAYVAVVAPGGVIEMLWPGYSASMLDRIAERLSSLTELPHIKIDVSAAPTELTSGCPF